MPSKETISRNRFLVLGVAGFLGSGEMFSQSFWILCLVSKIFNLDVLSRNVVKKQIFEDQLDLKV